MRFFAIIIVVAAAAFAVGCAQKAHETAGGEAQNMPETAGGGAAPREMQIEVTDRGFEPATTVIGTGEAVTLVFTRKTEQTCATDVMFPRLKLHYDLPLEQPVRVAIPAGAVTDTLYFACGMNMITGMIKAK